MLLRTLFAFSISLPATAGTDILYGDVSAAKVMEDARKAEKPVTIIVSDGPHFITDPIVLGPQDSGIRWVAQDGAEPIISGGRKITGWE